MNSKKLKISDLKVKSFVTDVTKGKGQTVKGGSFYECGGGGEFPTNLFEECYPTREFVCTKEECYETNEQLVCFPCGGSCDCTVLQCTIQIGC